MSLKAGYISTLLGYTIPYPTIPYRTAPDQTGPAEAGDSLGSTLFSLLTMLYYTLLDHTRRYSSLLYPTNYCTLLYTLQYSTTLDSILLY